MRIGTAPVSWGVNELNTWDTVLPVNRVLDEMEASGYLGTELGPWGFLPDDVAGMRRELSKRNLQLIGGFCPVKLHIPSEAAQQRAFAHDVSTRLRDLGSQALVLAEAGDDTRLQQAGQVQPGVTPMFTAEDWRRFADGANEVAADARALGLVTAFHAHVGTYVETEGELEELLSRVDASLVGVCIDSGHLAYAGADPVAITKRHRARVKHVHLKDVDERTLAQARRDKLSFREAVGKRIFVPLGTGMVDLPSMLHELEEASFDGWLVVEQDTRILTPEQEGQPLRDATTSRQELRRLLGR